VVDQEEVEVDEDEAGAMRLASDKSMQEKELPSQKGWQGCLMIGNDTEPSNLTGGHNVCTRVLFEWDKTGLLYQPLYPSHGHT
jgi:hypothetical protein